MKHSEILKSLFYCVPLCFYPLAKADVVIVPSGGEVKILIDKAQGSLLQLPSGVKTITPSSYFQIVDVGSDVDPVSGIKKDVRLFQVRSLPGGKSDHVTFVLGNGKPVKTHLIPSDAADKYTDLVFPTESKKVKHTKFLQAEISLMSAMMKDQGGDFARQIKDSSIQVRGMEGVSGKLVRLFAGQGLTGYVIELRNESSKPLDLDVSRLDLGNEKSTSEKPILLHAEKEKIESCGLFSRPECKARILVVARGDGPWNLKGTSAFGLRVQTSLGDPNAPFVREPQDGEVQP